MSLFPDLYQLLSEDLTILVPVQDRSPKHHGRKRQPSGTSISSSAIDGSESIAFLQAVPEGP